MIHLQQYSLHRSSHLQVKSSNTVELVMSIQLTTRDDAPLHASLDRELAYQLHTRRDSLTFRNLDFGGRLAAEIGVNIAAAVACSSESIIPQGRGQTVGEYARIHRCAA